MDKFFSMEEFRFQLLAVERDFEKIMVLQTQNTMSSNAGTYSTNSSRSVKYGMSSTGMPSHAILSSQYTGLSTPLKEQSANVQLCRFHLPQPQSKHLQLLWKKIPT
ncbi:hypothetical protein RchiOBHm_Chr1g0337331 [Rosa chinensis]|uniref:Uncharacterized protein n=1 Tax=Rosa chinensis TaxID=74649 RepID=A0A2P6SCX3_ROSCH|nr:hypothetical protein RchiOBHm_Chr1g0337331 [Rosa chinensis]